MLIKYIIIIDLLYNIPYLQLFLINHTLYYNYSNFY